jgi:hypothetical protein
VSRALVGHPHAAPRRHCDAKLTMYQHTDTWEVAVTLVSIYSVLNTVMSVFIGSHLNFKFSSLGFYP